MTFNIKRLQNRKEIIETRWVSINNKEYSLDDIIQILDNIYYDGKNRWEYVDFEYIGKSTKKILDMLEKLGVIESHSGGYWKGNKFDEFYTKTYELLW
ncbi:MAG: hypothetical protein ACOC56_03155 [Atribacterota bacterium]